MNDAHKGKIREWIEDGLSLEVIGSGEIQRDIYTGFSVLYEMRVKSPDGETIRTNYAIIIEFREAITIYMQTGSAVGSTKYKDLDQWEMPEPLRLSLPPWFI